MNDTGAQSSWGTIRGHLRRHRRAYGLVAMGGIALLALAGVFGPRGLGPAASDLASAAGSPPSSDLGALKTPQPLLELTASLLGARLGLPVLPVLQGLGLVAMAAAVPAVYVIADDIGGWISGASAALVFGLLPQTIGTATTVGTGAILVGIWTWFLRLSILERHRWYTTGLLWFFGATLVLLWPPFLLWGAVWLAIEVVDADYASDSPASMEGEYGGSSIPIAMLLAPVAVVAIATIIHPSLWRAPVEGWKTFGKFFFQWTGPAVTLAGETYDKSRPPLTTGLRVLWWTLPAWISLATLAGWGQLLWSKWRESRSARLAQRMVLWALPLGTFLPWLNRGTFWANVHFTRLLAPLLAVAAGVGIGHMIRSASSLLNSDVQRRWSRNGLLGLVALLLAGTAWSAHPIEGSYYNPIAGGFEAALARGLPATRDSVYPAEVLRRAARRADADSLAVLGDNNLVRDYRRLGYLSGPKPAKSPAAADARVRRIGRFSAGKSSVLKNPRAVVDLSNRAAPLLRIDGYPIYWVEW